MTSNMKKNKNSDLLNEKNSELKDEKNDEIILGKYEDAPNYLKDNEYIKTGYLINCNSVNKVLRSLFKWSNETVNVWSHLLGCVLAIIFIFYCVNYIQNNQESLINRNEQLLNNFNNILFNFIQKINKNSYDKITINNSILISIISKSNKFIENSDTNKILFLQNINNFINEIKTQINQWENLYKNNDNKTIKNITNELTIFQNNLYHFVNNEIYHNDKISYAHIKGIKCWPLYIMLVSAIICLGFSTTYHLFGIYNKKVNKILSRLDYGGIMFLVSGSCYPPYFFFFYCEKYLYIIYLFAITFSAFCLFIFTLTPDFEIPEKRNLRGICFLTIGISTSIPILHLTFFPKNIYGFYDTPNLKYWYYGGLSYVVGGTIYVLRIPEKYWKGKFDIIGHSHQILHLFVDLGFILHYLGCLDSYYYRLNRQCPNL